MKTNLRKSLLVMELGGIIFSMLGSYLMKQLYELSGRELIGILFGSVNASIWESCKTLLLPCLLWGILEVLCLQPSLHRFAPAKTVSLYVLGVSYLFGSLLMSGMKIDSSLSQLILSAVCLTIADVLTYALYFSNMELSKFFAPCLFLLFLFLAFYFSFTPFPPKNIIFEDAQTGMYGIIPEHIDQGAYALDTMYLLS